MSKIKIAYEIDEALFNAIELHYAAADALDEILMLTEDSNPSVHAYIKVLQSQSKRIAGKLKQVRIDHSGKESNDGER